MLKMRGLTAINPEPLIGKFPWVLDKNYLLDTPLLR
jgi:hypothetical protein